MNTSLQTIYRVSKR